MKADDILDSLRSVVLIINDFGVIEDARGGFGGFFGFDVAGLVGTSVLDHVHPDDADEVAVYFLESREEKVETIAVPMPFRMRVCSPDGLSHQVDVIPSGTSRADGQTLWTAEVVPVALFGTTTRSLDLELAGAPREEVCRMLCEELVVDNMNYTNRWVLVDLTSDGGPMVTTSRAADADLVEAVASDLADGWAPWERIDGRASTSVDLDTLGTALAGVIERRSWHRVIVSPVLVRGRLAGAMILMGSVPVQYRPDHVRTNVASRIQKLVQTTAMLFERWAAQDQLAIAASTDELTGLLNRRAFFEVLDGERRSGSVLFVDVDDFKLVNDTFGHEVGDHVLCSIADRIGAACRSDDTVARFGGDEFVVLAGTADDATTEELAERIVRSVQQPLGLEVGPDIVTVSVGHAPLGSSGAREALDVADAAMLGLKRPGRRLRSAVEAPAPDVSVRV